MDVSQDRGHYFLSPKRKLLSQIKQAKNAGCADSQGNNFPSILALYSRKLQSDLLEEQENQDRTDCTAFFEGQIFPHYLRICEQVCAA